MPSESRKQHRFMEAVKHNPDFAKKAGVPQSVGRDFVAADKAAGKYGAPGKPYVSGSSINKRKDK